MTGDQWLKLFLAAFLGLMTGCMIVDRNEKEQRERGDQIWPKYLPYFSGIILPLFSIGLFCLTAFFRGGELALLWVSALIFEVFVLVSIYYGLLLFLIPVLRKRISSRACAVLWIIPNFLYYFQVRLKTEREPGGIITIPGIWAKLLPVIWLVGVIAILGWKLAEHLAFRRRILTDSLVVTEPEVLEVWEQELTVAGIQQADYYPVWSPAVKSPLSIGFFKRKIRVVLPERAYTREELALIFRHEIIHIGREDSINKFFFVFCCAVCWFNPLMWYAMRKSADDLELSCDETVLLGQDDETRRRYGELLLQTAGNEAGFTTCLSASAAALRYRLQNLIRKKKTSSGAIVVGLTAFLLAMSSGYLTLAFEAGTGAETIFQGEGWEAYEIRYTAQLFDDKPRVEYLVKEKTEFFQFLSELKTDRLAQLPQFRQEHRYVVMIQTPHSLLSMSLYDDLLDLSIVKDGGISRGEFCYALPEGLDWEHLESLLIKIPELDLSVTGDWRPRTASAHSDRLWKEGAEENLIDDVQEGAVWGIHGDYTPKSVAFEFSHELAGPYTVTVESWDRTTETTVVRNDTTSPYWMDLADYDAHYRVQAPLRYPDGNVYVAEFAFSVGDRN